MSQPRREPRKLPVAEVEAAIRQHKGNVSAIAGHFDVKRSVIYLKMRAKPTLAQAWQDERERWKDMAERNVVELLEARDWRATVLVLTTIAKDRGWALPKGALSTEDPGQVTQLTVNNISIQGIEHDRFAPAGTESVHIEAIAPPPPEPESEDDILITEGEFTEADDASA